jgi:AcrR family transcriptional regulator
MSESVLAAEGNTFLARARYPKGRQRLQAILDATYEIVTSQGLAAASQEAIARRANVTQSAVRHYFPSKEELLLAFFTVGVERIQIVLEEKLAEQHPDPRTKLLDIVATHIDWISDVEDVYYFESAAFWARNPGFRDLRENWYQKLARHYCDLLSEIHPDWTRSDCEATSFQIMTLSLGTWTTIGNTRPLQQRRSQKSLKKMVRDGVEKLISDT